jgi:hypothetical protein
MLTGNRARRGAWTGPQSASIGCGIQARKTCRKMASATVDASLSNRVIIVALSMGGTRAISKPVFAALLASAIVYLCFLTWLHWKAVSLVKQQGATGLIAVTGA